MSALLATPLLLALFPALSAPVWSASEEGDVSGARHLERTAENAGARHPVRISPHPFTGRVFDTPLQPGGVEVDDEQRGKVAVNAAEGLVTQRPSEAPPPDRPLTVTVRFADGQVPGSVTFRLEVHPTRAEHPERVCHQPRSCERCEAALEQERTRPEGPRPNGLSDLFEAGLVSAGKRVVVRKLTGDVIQRPGEMLSVKQAWSYRAELQHLVAVELRVVNTSSLPWTADGVEGAELVSTQGVRLRVVRVWQPQPFEPGQLAQIVVEAEATVKQLQGTFLLKLDEAGGPRTLTVRGVSFP
ncbi:MAG TPA: DUF2381 family protein [Archangium sp.]|nr:DUF2381 family protein [Archangium sp.]